MGEVITFEDFVSRKIAWYVQMWKYGRHDDKAFARNMTLMGYDKQTIQECLDEFYNEE